VHQSLSSIVSQDLGCKLRRTGYESISNIFPVAHRILNRIFTDSVEHLGTTNFPMRNTYEVPKKGVKST
jgi:hypothetical protein